MRVTVLMHTSGALLCSYRNAGPMVHQEPGKALVTRVTNTPPAACSKRKHARTFLGKRSREALHQLLQTIIT